MTTSTGQADEAPFLSGMDRGEESPEVRMFRVSGMAEGLRGILQQINEVAREALARAKAMAMGVRERERGPDPDADIDRDDDLHAVARAFERLADRMDKMSNQPPSSYNNGGNEKASGISRWHLVLAVIGVVIPVVGAAWGLSMQISAQSAMISSIRDHQRDQDERATRVENQLQQLSRDRR